MKGMKGKFIKKLKTVKQIGHLKPDRILQVSALDGFVDNFSLKSAFVDNFPFKSHNKPRSPRSKPKPQPNQEKPEIIDVVELMKDLEEDEEGNDEEFGSENDKENISPLICSDIVGSLDRTERSLENVSSGTESSCCTELEVGDSDSKQMPLSEIDISSFRRPDMDSGSLFDPNLLSAFEKAVSEHMKSCEAAAAAAQSKPKTQNHIYSFFNPEDEPDPLSEFEDQTDPLSEFEEKCPPGGSDSVIFYTTSLRGIRKTFEDCQSIRFLLESFRVIYYERDVSIHSEYRDELWRIMGEKLLPPRLFIKGRHIGGAEQVLRLNEQGRLRPLFRDIPIDFNEGPCNGCCGLRFALCLHCNGSRKLFDPELGGDKNGGFWRKCLECNENGLIVCPFCS